MQEWEQIRNAFSKAHKILLLTHIHADGDCLGSAFALAYFLCGRGKEVCVLAEELPPANLSFLYDRECMPENLTFSVWDSLSAEELPAYDLAAAIDTSDEARLGLRKKAFDRAKIQVRIDHHISEASFAELTVCHPEWAATAEGIWKLLETYEDFRESPYLREIAECVYAGILTDTGCFAYSNVTPMTHRIAAELMELAGNLAWQYSKIYENQTKSEIALKALAYGAVEYYHNGTVAFLQIRREQMDAVGARDDDLESFAPFLRAIEQVSVGIFVKPGKKPDQYRISLRSDERCDVAAVAAKFGGGGHKRAAGLVCNADTFSEFKENLIGEVIKWMV